jgi:citrate lyase beta subunit
MRAAEVEALRPSEPLRAVELGATLYCPASHYRLEDVLRGRHLPRARSVVVCTEDSLNEAQAPAAVEKLRAVLTETESRRLRDRLFLRPRSVEVLQTLLEAGALAGFAGIVIPKATVERFEAHAAQLAAHPHLGLMPTLETREMLDASGRRALRRAMEESPLRDRILACRIGGNDLMALLRLRRPRGRTIYETPLRSVIEQLVTSFAPAGFDLSGPVCELLDAPDILAREVEIDLEHGLLGKTAIHPGQIEVIEGAMRVDPEDLGAAKQILAEDAPGVFAASNRMCEPATHRPWAERLLERADVFGVRKLAEVRG